jgi:hypothetical protein
MMQPYGAALLLSQVGSNVTTSTNVVQNYAAKQLSNILGRVLKCEKGQLGFFPNCISCNISEQ